MKIEIKDVSKTIKGTMVLRNISLSLESGMIYGLQGKNGAGKTMLLRMLCGLILPSTGEVWFDNKKLGEDISFPDSVGVLIENPGFVANYSGLKNLKNLASINDTIDEDTIKQLMYYFNLHPEDKKKVKNYSLGMKQKIGLISALMENPKLILLDEPLNALDEESANKLLQILKERKEQGVLIVVASHDKEELSFLADHMITMKDGRVISRKKEEGYEEEKNKI